MTATGGETSLVRAQVAADTGDGREGIRLARLFFPEGMAYDGHRFDRTADTAPLFSYLAPSESADEKMVSRRGNRTPNPQIKSLATTPGSPSQLTSSI